MLLLSMFVLGAVVGLTVGYLVGALREQKASEAELKHQQAIAEWYAQELMRVGKWN